MPFLLLLTPTPVMASPLPPPAATISASRSYPVTTWVETNHRGWREASGYVNVPQDVRIRWHVDTGGRAELRLRDAWDSGAQWRHAGTWARGSAAAAKGETLLRIDRPTLLSLRVQAPRFPRSGIARLRANYERRTVAVLRGDPGGLKRPVLLAEGYDPFNEYDWNDPSWQKDPTLAGLITAGRTRHDLDTWLVDWGDAGAAMEQQAEDFADLARQVRAWNDGKSETVAVGASMGAVVVRYALASAADSKSLGVRKYISLNGPHRGAWVSPSLSRFLLKASAKGEGDSTEGSWTAWQARRAMASPAASQLIIGGDGHAAFYAALRGLGTGGYDPAIPRVGFSNGTLVREGEELADWAAGNADVIHRVTVRPLWLPVRITVRRTRRDFRYGAYPGELLGERLRRPVRHHMRLLGLFRLDFRADWEGVPTFIPTHSALDFPEELAGGPARFHYSRWRETAFARIYVARGRNLAHDDTSADWIDPRTGRAAPGGENALLYEIAQASPDRRPPASTTAP